VTFLIDNWMLVAIALVTGGLLLWPVVRRGGVAGGLAPSEAVQLINREKGVVVDVCSDAEFAAGHVGGARHIPLTELEDKLPTLVKNRNVPVIMVCASGVRSGQAVGIARKLGYEKAQSLHGGLKAWRAAGLPVEKA